MKICPTCKTQYPEDANFCPQESCATSDGPQRLQWIAAQSPSRFQTTERIGGDRTGDVWRARDSQTGAEVVCKFVATQVLSTPAAFARAEREFKQLMRVSAPKVAAILDCGKTPAGLLSVAMEYCPGDSLERILVAGPIGFDQAKSIILQVGQALLEAQKVGLVHRDIAPKNILISASGDVKLINFPIAKPINDRVAGVAAYLSPEQVQGKLTDQRSNTYSLAAILYHLLTGVPPFQATTDQAVLDMQVSSPVMPPTQRSPNADLPADADKLLLKALEKSSSRRHLTLRLFLNELEALKKAQPAGTIKKSAEGGLAKTMMFGSGSQAEIAKMVAEARAAKVAATPVPVPVAASLRMPAAPIPVQTTPASQPLAMGQTMVAPEHGRVQAHAQAPMQAHAQAPVQARVQTPVQARVQATPGPMQTHAQAHVYVPVLAQMQVPAEPPVPMPSQGGEPHVQAPVQAHHAHPTMPQPAARPEVATAQDPVPVATTSSVQSSAEDEYPPTPPLVAVPLRVSTPAAPPAAVPARSPAVAKPAESSKAPAPQTGAAFRETLWFKKGDVEQMVAEAKAKLQAAGKPAVDTGEFPVDARPLEDRYVDDGSVTVEDRKKFSLRTGGTAVASPNVVAPAVPGEKMDERQIVGEIGGGRRTLILVVAALVILALVVVIVMMAKGKGSKVAAPLPVASPNAVESMVRGKPATAALVPGKREGQLPGSTPDAAQVGASASTDTYGKAGVAAPGAPDSATKPALGSAAKPISPSSFKAVVKKKPAKHPAKHKH